jgi:hypothetical protein
MAVEIAHRPSVAASPWCLGRIGENGDNFAEARSITGLELQRGINVWANLPARGTDGVRDTITNGGRTRRRCGLG